MKILSLLSLMTLLACTQGESQPQYSFTSNTDQQAAFNVGKEVINKKDLTEGLESDIYSLERKIYDLKMKRMKEIAVEKLMEQDPKKKGLTVDQYFKKYIAQNMKIKEEEINQFVKDRNIPEDQVNPSIKQKIREYLYNEKKDELLADWLAKKTKKNPIEVYFKRPSRPQFDVAVGSAPYTGDENAKVTVVEFSDFQCPFCKRGAVRINEIKKKYGNKVKVVFKNFPLPFHKQAPKAAEAALCAEELKKGMFWDYHDALFADQGNLKPEDLIKKAEKLKLDKEKFSGCLNSSRYAAAVAKDIQQGTGLNIQATPTFFINGKLIAGAEPLQEFIDVIEEELKRP